MKAEDEWENMFVRKSGMRLNCLRARGIKYGYEIQGWFSANILAHFILYSKKNGAQTITI